MQIEDRSLMLACNNMQLDGSMEIRRMVVKFLYAKIGHERLHCGM